MTAAARGRQLSDLKSGVRPFDPGRDLVALADLIEAGFGENLDPSGRRLVQSLRLLGRFGRLGGTLSRWLLPPAANPQGYVWEEDGQVVGNASLLPVTGYPTRWVMANVAVQPEHRRRAWSLIGDGIGGVRWPAGAREIVLQVDQENAAAVGLYRSLGFQEAPARTTWVGRSIRRDIDKTEEPVRRRRASEWHAQWELARRIHPDGVLWPYPASGSLFRPACLGAASGIRVLTGIGFGKRRIDCWVQ